jgi:integrase/recombinase XerD
MARPAGRPRAVREASVYDLREEFLARCRAKNLSDRTMEWYEDRTLQLCDLWTARGAALASELTVEHVEDALVDLRERGLAPQTVRGFAQIAKTLCRFGHRKGLIPDEIAHDLEMPRVPQTIIETFTDDQLEALLSAPDRRRWIGIRDRALLLTLLDTLCRVSELVGLNAEDVDLKGRTIRVMGKGRIQRELPLGKATCQALARYFGALDDLRPGDPFFISCRGRRLSRWYAREVIADYGIEGRNRRRPVLASHAAPHGCEAVHPRRRRRVHPPEASGSQLTHHGASVRRACEH